MALKPRAQGSRGCFRRGSSSRAGRRTGRQEAGGALTLFGVLVDLEGDVGAAEQVLYDFPENLDAPASTVVSKNKISQPWSCSGPDSQPVPTASRVAGQ